MAPLKDIDAALAALVERALARLAERVPAVASRRDTLARLALCSDFAIDTLVRQPELLQTLDAPAQPVPVLDPDSEADWPTRIRR